MGFEGEGMGIAGDGGIWRGKDWQQLTVVVVVTVKRCALTGIITLDIN